MERSTKDLSFIVKGRGVTELTQSGMGNSISTVC